MDFKTLVIPIEPRGDYFAENVNQDMPTVPESFLPYTTALNAEEFVYKTYGELWMTYMHNSALFLEM